MKRPALLSSETLPASSGLAKKCSQVASDALWAFLVWPALIRHAMIEIGVLDPLDMWQRVVESIEDVTQKRWTFRTAQQQDVCAHPSEAFKAPVHTLRAERRFAALPRLRPQEGQQVGVELLLAREGQAVGRAWIDLQGGILDELGGEQGRVADWHDLVVVTVDNQGWNVELLEVFGLVRLGEGLDAVECGFETDLHRPQPERVQNALGDLGARPVGAEEGYAEILVELRAVRGDAGADLVECFDGQTAWIGLCLEHQRRHRAHQHGLGEA